jgi:hypothetical protein
MTKGTSCSNTWENGEIQNTWWYPEQKEGEQERQRERERERGQK